MSRVCCQCGAPVEGLGVAAERELQSVTDPAERAALRAALERVGQPNCESCDAADREATELADAERERRVARERRHNRELLCGIPKKYRVQFEDLDDGGQPEAFAAYQAWACAELDGLVAIGPVGVGKTTPAGAAAWARLDHGPLRWYSAPALVTDLSADFSSPRHRRALEALTRPVALVLDDLDKARPTEYVAEQLYLAIDERYSSGAGLLITSNLTLDELAARLPERHGEAIVSRLVEYCEVFALEGVDRRLEATG